jgi:GWxTD domain-containing protein
VRKTPHISRAARAFALILLVAAAGCSGIGLGSRPPQAGSGPQSQGANAGGSSSESSTPGAGRRDGEASINVIDFNRRLGLIAHGAPLPFSGSVTYLAARTADSTHVLVSLTLAPSALVFARESDQYRAGYRVNLIVKRGEATASRTDAVETVRVASVREAQSGETSILFQQVVTLAPGAYALSVNVTDEASAKKGATEVTMQVPALGVPAVSRPVAYFEVTPRVSRDSLPRIVANPRATFTFARDSTIDMYVEAYGVRPHTRLNAAVQVEGTAVWVDSVELRDTDGQLATATVRVPVVRFAPGLAEFAVWLPGTSDTVKTPVFVSYGEPVPVTTFADMLGYLRYFASENRLRALLAAPVQSRGMAWANFYRETDQNSATMPNESLGLYLERLRYVDAQFGEGSTPGWRTDRGMVYLLFGQYDVQVDPFGASMDRSERGRALEWEYRGQNLTVEFVRTGTFGSWRLTPASEQAVRNAARRLLGGDIQR